MFKKRLILLIFILVVVVVLVGCGNEVEEVKDKLNDKEVELLEVKSKNDKFKKEIEELKKKNEEIDVIKEKAEEIEEKYNKEVLYEGEGIKKKYIADFEERDDIKRVEKIYNQNMKGNDELYIELDSVIHTEDRSILKFRYSVNTTKDKRMFIRVFEGGEFLEAKEDVVDGYYIRRDYRGEDIYQILESKTFDIVESGPPNRVKTGTIYFETDYIKSLGNLTVNVYSLYFI